MKKLNKCILLILTVFFTLSTVGCSAAQASLTGALVYSKKKPSSSPAIEENVEESTSTAEEDVDEKDDTELSEVQLNSINMLNYMSALAVKVNESSGNQLALESIYRSLVNDLYPNSIDEDTQDQITDLMSTIESYRMIDVKRERLEFIYEQNKASALKQAIPNPLSLLNVVQSKNKLEAIVSVLYMTVDSVSSYQNVSSQADLQYIESGWELDDTEKEELNKATINQLNYLLKAVRNYNIPGDYVLSEEAVENYVKWENKNDNYLTNKIDWFEKNIDTYKYFGSYWLELAEDYYKNEDYEKCLESVNQYEMISTRIFRKDIDYAEVLPMAILSAKETMNDTDYKEYAKKYCEVIEKNTKDSDWDLRYFIAQIYVSLYANYSNENYLDRAYKIVFNNVNTLVDEQKELNETYLSPIVEVKTSKDDSKEKKKEIKQYNKLLKEERKTALPRVNEALYLNCELLFALANEMNVSKSEQSKIEKILHTRGESLFLIDVLDNRYWFSKKEANIDDSKISFDGDEIKFPASYISDQYSIKVIVSNNGGTSEFDDWKVKKVSRPKNSTVCSEFTVSLESENANKYKYTDGDYITIEITSYSYLEDTIEIEYVAKVQKKLFVLNDVKFERVTK